MYNLAPSEIDRLGEKSAGNNIARRRDTQKIILGNESRSPLQLTDSKPAAIYSRVSFKEFNHCKRRLNDKFGWCKINIYNPRASSM